MDGGSGITVSARLRRATPTRESYTVCFAQKKIRTLVTANGRDARRWLRKTRHANEGRIRSSLLVVGLAVNEAPTKRRHRRGVNRRPPAILQLCTGRRCILFNLAKAGGVPAELGGFLRDPAVHFVGRRVLSDKRFLSKYYGLRVACIADLDAMAGSGNISLENMAEKFLGYSHIPKLKDVAGAREQPQMSLESVKRASLHTYLAFRQRMCPG